MRILSIGSMSRLSNTCRFRNSALEKYADKVDVINTSHKSSILSRFVYHLFQLGIPLNTPDYSRVNEQIINLIKRFKYDIIWVDKGLEIYPRTIDCIRKHQASAVIVNFSPDNMMKRPWQSNQYIQCFHKYDYHITTKSFLVDDFYKHGAKNVILVNKTFQPDFHFPHDLTKQEKERFGADVGFIGSWEDDRCQSIFYLGENGIKVKVWGDGKWCKYINKHPNVTIIPYGLFSEDYAKSFAAIKISLCFLKKKAKDLQTARSIEIPACGGFMLAERTEEHKRLFEEDLEAVYFSSNNELLEKCKYYLAHKKKRETIAAAGRRRCLKSDYSNEGMIYRVLQEIQHHHIK